MFPMAAPHDRMYHAGRKMSRQTGGPRRAREGRCVRKPDQLDAATPQDDAIARGRPPRKCSSDGYNFPCPGYEVIYICMGATKQVNRRPGAKCISERAEMTSVYQDEKHTVSTDDIVRYSKEKKKHTIQAAPPPSPKNRRLSYVTVKYCIVIVRIMHTQ